MFYIISRFFSFLILPVGIMLALMIYILCHKNHTKVKKASLILLIIFFFFSCPWITDQMAVRYEVPQKPLSSYATYDIGIVLTGGIINENQDTTSGIHLDVSGDRLWQTLMLYRQKKIRRILISGFDNSMNKPGKIYEVDLCKSFLVYNGVNSEDIILEKKAKNTRENAVYSAAIIKKYYPESTLLLITSAFHMRRAAGCFRKTGLNPDLLPASYISNHLEFRLMHFVPSSVAFYKSGLLVKEWWGYLVYLLSGYL